MNDLRSIPFSCKIAAIVGLFYIVIAISLAVFPDAVISTIDWKSKAGLIRIAALDFVIGVTLIWTAPSSRFPVGLNIFGGLALLGAIYYFLVPVDFVAAYLDWWLEEQLTFTRIVGFVFGLAAGAFILFAVLSPPRYGRIQPLMRPDKRIFREAACEVYAHAFPRSNKIGYCEPRTLRITE